MGTQLKDPNRALTSRGSRNGGYADAAGQDIGNDVLAQVGVAALGSISQQTAGGPAPGQSQISICVFVTLAAASALIPLLTPPVGRRFMITDLTVTTTAASAFRFELQSGVNGLRIFANHINATKGIESPGIESPPTVPSGQQLNLSIPSITGEVAVVLSGVLT